jgi:heme-degrading monooxygenase HmoA
MWVRIDEITFAAGRADDVVDHLRNNALTVHEGPSFLGFRLLMDADNGGALNVSYWNDRDDAAQDVCGSMSEPHPGAETVVVRTTLYELAIDAA